MKDTPPVGRQSPANRSYAAQNASAQQVPSSPEGERLAALRRYGILDSPPEPGFDRITALAARLFGVPVCIISLVDESRVWFKSKVGWQGEQVERGESLCALAILQKELLVIHDARLDSRLECNRWVQAEPGIRFYAGAPLVNPDGFKLGTLCLIDTQPHETFDPGKRQTLTDLAAMVVDELELRFLVQRTVRTDQALLEVVEGVSRSTGEGFFPSLVRHLSQVLKVRCAFIGELVDSEAVRTLAIWDRTGPAAQRFYPLAGTPCREVIVQSALRSHPQAVQQNFPGLHFCEDWQPEGYLAAPLLDPEGRCLGLLAIVDDRPLEDVPLAELLVPIFAVRAAGELERSRLDAAEREARLAAEAANRVKDEFLAILGHELRTPLNPIIGWTQMLRRGKVPQDKLEQVLEIIERNARLQNTLMDDLLDVSRIVRGGLSIVTKTIAARGVGLAAVEAVRGLAEEKGVHLFEEFAAEAIVEADPTRLQQVVWNLLTNAIKFTPPGGEVWVRLACSDLKAQFTVSDTGAGITPEFLPHLFERFRQANTKATRGQKGLGLGLFIVRYIAEAHGGTVTAASPGEGGGATFTVTLPLSPVAPPG